VSPVSRIKRQYKDAIRSVEGYAQAVGSTVSDIKSFRSDTVPWMPGAEICDDNHGEYVDALADAHQQWKSKMDVLFGESGALVQASEELDEKLSVLRERYKTLCDMRDEEKAGGFVYEESDIPF